MSPRFAAQFRMPLAVAVAFLGATTLARCYLSPHGYGGYQPVQQPIYATPGSGAATTAGYSASGAAGPAASAPGVYTPPTSAVAPQNDLLSPPYFGRIFIGRVPYQDNDLVYRFYNGTGNHIEVWLDGQPLTIVFNNQRVLRPVVRGDHTGRSVSPYPASNWDPARLMVDSPGAHGFEVWCYTDVPGLGLVQVGHRTFSNTSNWAIGLGCQ